MSRHERTMGAVAKPKATGKTAPETTSAPTSARSGLLQRKCACGGTPGPTGECAGCRRKRLQRRSAGRFGPATAPPIVHDVLRSPGQPLEADTRAFMESRFGHDFGRVRVHTDARAAESARAVGALAYTVGRDVVFGAGQHPPGTSRGRSLLAHELAHVVQQSGSTPASGNSAADVRSPETAAAGRVGGRWLQRQAIDNPPASRRSSGTLPYREATELLDCIRIMGRGSADYCRHEVLGEPMPPGPTHHELPGITTPQPVDVRLNPNGTANFGVNGFDVVFDPDVQSTDPAMTNKAKTTFDIAYGAIRWAPPREGRISSFTGPGVPRVTIRTTYGPGVGRTSPSGYGRGTTPADVAAGATSLGFHEGRHGLDFVEFLSQNRFPRFLGRVGMTTKQFENAADAFKSAIILYKERMDRFSELRTDCVGTTIDQSNRANGFTTSICQQAPGGGP